MKFPGRKFMFGIVTIICASVVAIMKGYSGEIYLEVVKWVCGLYVAGQTVVDFKEKGVPK